MPDQIPQRRLAIISRVILVASLAYASAGLLTSSQKVLGEAAVWHGVTAATHLLLPLGCSLFPVLLALPFLCVEQAGRLPSSRRRLASCGLILAASCLAFYGAIWFGA